MCVTVFPFFTYKKKQAQTHDLASPHFVTVLFR